MKILILNWRDIRHPLSGGAEISTHEHAKAWVKAGHQVIYFSSFFKGAKKTEETDGINFIRYGNHYTVHLWAFLYFVTKLRGKIDLIVDEFHFIPFFSTLYFHGKILAFIHETAGEIWFKNKPFPVNLICFLLEPLFFKLYTNVFFMTVSDSTKKDIIKFGIKKENIRVVHNGVWQITNKYTKERVPTIIYLGKLAEDKGVKEAILAFEMIKKNIEKIKFWIAGKEEKAGYQNKIKEMVDKKGIKNETIFFGYVSESKKHELLKKAWILIHPSIKEGWGLTVMEAAVQGTPTVAYNIVGLRDSIRNDITGLLTKNKHPEELAKKILMLCKNRVLYKKLGDNACIWSKTFNWEKAQKQSLQLIEKL